MLRNEVYSSQELSTEQKSMEKPDQMMCRCGLIIRCDGGSKDKDKDKDEDKDKDKEKDAYLLNRSF